MAPPPPEVIILLPLKLYIPAKPIVPKCFFLIKLPIASAASSIRIIFLYQVSFLG